MRWLLALMLVGCGDHGGAHGGGDTPDASDPVADDAAEPDAAIDAPSCEAGKQWCTDACVDTETSHDHCGDCTTICGADETCNAGTCKPGAPKTANGACTYVDQPGWLSCPTGMSCQCYYHYYKLFENQPGHLDTWLSTAQLEILGGTIPQNSTVFGISPVTIPLQSGMGAVAPYTVTATATTAHIRLYATSGYVPAKFVIQTDADCGNRGKILDCTFDTP